MNYKKLHDELKNDPERLGYAGKTDAEKLALLDGVTQTVDRPSISAQELVEATVMADYEKLTETDRQHYLALVCAGSLDLNDVNTAAVLDELFTSTSQTRTNLTALKTELKSRADVLGLGKVKAGYIEKANAIGAQIPKGGL